MIPSPGLSRVSVDPGQINQVLMNLAVKLGTIGAE